MIEIETNYEEVETPMIEAPAQTLERPTGSASPNLPSASLRCIPAPQLRCTKSASVLKAGALPQTPKVGALAETSDQSELKKTRTCPECGAAFVPRAKNQKYCSAECAAETGHRKNQQDETIKAIRAKRRAEEKRERAAREARLKRRDVAYAANAPRTKVVTRGKIKVELRGMVPVAAWQPKRELRVKRPGGYGWKNF